MKGGGIFNLDIVENLIETDIGVPTYLIHRTMSTEATENQRKPFISF